MRGLIYARADDVVGSDPTLKEYGLEHPFVEVEARFADGTTRRLRVGKQAPAPTEPSRKGGTYRYAHVDGVSRVFLINEFVVARLRKKPDELKPPDVPRGTPGGQPAPIELPKDDWPGVAVGPGTHRLWPCQQRIHPLSIKAGPLPAHAPVEVRYGSPGPPAAQSPNASSLRSRPPLGVQRNVTRDSAPSPRWPGERIDPLPLMTPCDGKPQADERKAERSDAALTRSRGAPPCARSKVNRSSRASASANPRRGRRTHRSRRCCVDTVGRHRGRIRDGPSMQARRPANATKFGASDRSV